MFREYEESTYNQIRDVIARLQSLIQDLPTLLDLLSGPLGALKIIPPQFLRHNISPLPHNALSLPKHIPLLQRALLEHVLPTWGPVLEENNSYELAQQYFAPDIFLMQIPAAKDVALHAYATILSLPLTEHSIRLLVVLTRTYPIDVLWSATVSRRKVTGSSNKSIVTWEDCVRSVVAVPAKVANVLGAKETAVPVELEQGAYFNNISRRLEILVSSLSNPSQGPWQRFISHIDEINQDYQTSCPQLPI